ncbi:MAG: AgmX/PglI C-terminal domain-containing protein [Deltaproteobacteria bacterium]|nr:AgmX/PglI C-terminal domain-containing protein [Deltaproteobacteria bacterium]
MLGTLGEGGALGTVFGDGGLGEGYGFGGLGLRGAGAAPSGTVAGSPPAGALGGLGSRDPGTTERPSPRAHVESGETTTHGALSKEDIRRVRKRHKARFRYCYERELMKDPNFKAGFVVHFAIEKSGSVSNVSTSGTIASPALRACVVESVSKMVFPAFKAGAVRVNDPLRFTQGS